MPATEAPDPYVGKRIGRYRVVRQIGIGGMGAVYLAERADEEFRQQVAIKALRPGLEEGDILRRFLVERQTLAGLEHPNIVRLLDGGTTEDGRPYLVMDYVEGLPIDEYAQAHHLSVEARLELFRTVCAAVHYAHQNLVVHRDLKPSNIMVTADGVPKLLDFGIAKILTPEQPEKAAGLTQVGVRPMTPHYASPEQILGQPITTASDIYSLGVLLYRLLSGQHPYTFTSGAEAELVQLICQRETEKPSALVRRLARAPGEAPRIGDRQGEALARRLAGDLDMIVMMALRKEPPRRYSSVEHLAEDLRRHLRGLPVTAQRDTLGYRGRKFVKRHRAAVAAAALVAVALVSSAIVSLEQKRRAERRFQEVRELARFVLFEFDDAIRSGVTPARKKLVERALTYLDRLAQETSADVSLRRELMEGYFKAGDVQGNLYGPHVGDAAGARQSYVRALELARQLHDASPQDPASRRDLARASVKLGDLSALGGDRHEALAEYRKALQVFDELAAASPKDLAARRDVLAVANKIGFTHYQLGNLEAALASYQRCLVIAQEWQKAEPGEGSARRAVAAGYERAGEVLARGGRTAEGQVNLRAALEIYQALAAARPSDAQAHRDVSNTHTIIGDILLGAGRTKEALESYSRGLEIAEALAREDPQNKQARTDLHLTLGRLADVLAAAGQRQEARDITERALRMLRALVDLPDASQYDLQNYAWLLGTTPVEELRNAARAEQYAQRAVEMTQGSDPRVLDTLARALEAGGKPERAFETEQKAVSLLPPPGPGGSVSDLRRELETNLARFRQQLSRAPPAP
jgi:non-specific serine/threonine protein kinase/serine/threonine-protein kinase